MPFIGAQPATTFAKATSQVFTNANGNIVDFTLNKHVSNPEDIEVFVANIQQQPTTSYTILSDGITLRFSEAPPSGDFYVVYRNLAQQTGIDTGAFRKTGGALSGTISNFTSTGIDDNADATAITINSSENIGIGTTPESHHANWTAIDIGDQGGLAHYDGGATSLSTNLYHDGAWKAKETGTSSRIEIGADGYVNVYSGASASADASVTLTKRLAIQPDGDVNVHTGNLRLGTNGKGIDFTDNSNVSGMTSELLDDYEEGQATVNFVSSGATFAFGGSDGSETTLYYVKIGRLVHYFMNWDSSSTVSGTTSNAVQIQNLPFSSSYGDTFSVWFHRGGPGAVDILPTAYSTNMGFMTSPTAGGMWSDMTAAALSHVDMRLRISGTTIVD